MQSTAARGVGAEPPPEPEGPGLDHRDNSSRSLRTVTRDGASLGETLVDEGLAEEWKGYRGSWC